MSELSLAVYVHMSKYVAILIIYFTAKYRRTQQLNMGCSFTAGCLINPLTPNDHYSGRTAPLTSKVAFYIFIQKNIGTEYFKDGVYSR